MHLCLGLGCILGGAGRATASTILLFVTPVQLQAWQCSGVMLRR